jgi:hypothetical protein
MKVLMAENKKSEKENTTLTTQRDSTAVVSECQKSIMRL